MNEESIDRLRATMQKLCDEMMNAFEVEVASHRSQTPAAKSATVVARTVDRAPRKRSRSIASEASRSTTGSSSTASTRRKWSDDESVADASADHAVTDDVT